MKLKQSHYMAIIAVILAIAGYRYWSRRSATKAANSDSNTETPAPDKETPNKKPKVEYLSLPFREQIENYDPNNLYRVNSPEGDSESYQQCNPGSTIYYTNQGDFTTKLVIVNNGEYYDTVIPAKGYWLRLLHNGHGEDGFVEGVKSVDDWDSQYVIELPMPSKLPLWKK